MRIPALAGSMVVGAGRSDRSSAVWQAFHVKRVAGVHPGGRPGSYDQAAGGSGCGPVASSAGGGVPLGATVDQMARLMAPPSRTTSART